MPARRYVPRVARAALAGRAPRGGVTCTCCVASYWTSNFGRKLLSRSHLSSSRTRSPSSPLQLRRRRACSWAERSGRALPFAQPARPPRRRDARHRERPTRRASACRTVRIHARRLGPVRRAAAPARPRPCPVWHPLPKASPPARRPQTTRRRRAPPHALTSCLPHLPRWMWRLVAIRSHRPRSLRAFPCQRCVQADRFNALSSQPATRSFRPVSEPSSSRLRAQP